MKSATAAAEPEDEPAGVWRRLCGLCVLPAWAPANSVVTALPSTMAPACTSWVTQAASLFALRPR